MNILTLTLFCLVLIGLSVPSQGQGRKGLQRCNCRGEVLRVKKQHIKSVHILPKSPSCSKIEIVLILKDNSKVCLDPKGTQGKRFIKSGSDWIGKRQKPKRKQNQKKPN